jgi:hypothetical protein
LRRTLSIKANKLLMNQRAIFALGIKEMALFPPFILRSLDKKLLPNQL